MTFRCSSSLVVRIALPLLIVLAAPPAHAGWTERGVRIARIDEILPGLRTAIGAPVQSNLAADAPVVIPVGADPASAKTLAVALVQSGYAFRAGINAWTVARADTRTESERARPRLRAASPVTPSSIDRAAIPSGTVALFGRLLEPPFRIERVGDAIEVNQVVVFPEPGPDVAPPVPSSRQVEAHGRIQQALAGFTALRARVGADAAHAQLLFDMRSLPGIARAEWINDTNLRLVQDNGVEEVLSFDEERAPDPETPAQLHQRLDTMVTGLRDVLRGGGTILCGASYLLTLPGADGTAFRSRIALGDMDAPEHTGLAELPAARARSDRRFSNRRAPVARSGSRHGRGWR